MAWTTATTRATDFFVTAAVWNSEHVDNMNFLKRVAFQTFSADVSITATTVGTANQIVSAGAVTYENVPHLIEFWAPRYTAPAQITNFILRDSTTVIGTLSQTASGQHVTGLYLAHAITPTAASHTYNVAAWNAAAGTGTVEAGSGGTAGDGTTILQGYIRIRREPT